MGLYCALIFARFLPWELELVQHGQKKKMAVVTKRSRESSSWKLFSWIPWQPDIGATFSTATNHITRMEVITIVRTYLTVSKTSKSIILWRIQIFNSSFKGGYSTTYSRMEVLEPLAWVHPNTMADVNLGENGGSAKFFRNMGIWKIWNLESGNGTSELKTGDVLRVLLTILIL